VARPSTAKHSVEVAVGVRNDWNECKSLWGQRWRYRQADRTSRQDKQTDEWQQHNDQPLSSH